MNVPTHANLIEWFASLTGKVPSTDTLVAEQAQRDAARREAERLDRPTRAA